MENEKTPIVIFGIGGISQLANYYFEIDSEYEVVAFTADEAYITDSTFEGKPVISFENIEDKYPPALYKMFIALSYAQLNKLRESKYLAAKKKGYTLVSYISSQCLNVSQYSIGENCFILEGSGIQPFTKIGNNVTIWSGACVGHHSLIGDHNFIGAQSVISGFCEIKNNCFIGANATIGQGVVIANDNLLGAGSVTIKSTEPFSAYVPQRSIKLEKKSNQINL